MSGRVEEPVPPRALAFDMSIKRMARAVHRGIIQEHVAALGQLLTNLQTLDDGRRIHAPFKHRGDELILAREDP